MNADAAREPSPIPGISRNVWILGLVSLATDASTEMIYPLVPLFLTQTLGASMATLGFIEGLAEGVASALKGVSGWVSDRVGRRRPLAIFGYGLAALTKPLLALAGGWPLVLAARVLDRFGKGVRGTPRDALIADSSDPALRGRAFGFHRSADQTGAVLGPLLAVPLLALFQGDFRSVFVVAFAPAAIGVAALLLVREGRPAAPGQARPVFRWRETPPAYRRFLFAMLFFAAGNSSDVFLIVRAQSLGLPPQRIALLFAAMNAAYVFSAYPGGAISDRLGRRRILTAGLFLFALVYLGFALAADSMWLWALFPLYGVYQGLTDGVSRAYIADLAPPAVRATALGFFAMTTGLAAFAASFAGGLLWQWRGAPATFLYGAVLAAAAGLALALRSSNRLLK